MKPLSGSRTRTDGKEYGGHCEGRARVEVSANGILHLQYRGIRQQSCSKIAEY